MGYDEEEELTRTDEFLLNLQLAGYSKELEVLPSEVHFLVFPIEADIQDHSGLDLSLDHGSIETPVNELEEVGVLMGKHDAGQNHLASEDNGVVFDYDKYSEWSWVTEFENMITQPFRIDDDLHIFNQLVSDKVEVGA